MESDVYTVFLRMLNIFVGELQPVIVTLPPLDDDEESEMEIDEPPVVESETKKGKRKA